MFDVEPSTEASAAADAVPPQCAPPPAEAVALLNAAEVRVAADDGADGVGSGEAAAATAAEGGQKVTPWEVEVSQPEVDEGREGEGGARLVQVLSQWRAGILS